MNVWCHLPTILGMRLNKRLAMRMSCIFLLCVALITTLFFGIIANAAPGINQTIGFQGRLTDSNGFPVPDGTYNIQFKIYQDGTGVAAGNPNGTLKWTETHANNGATTGLEIKNGYFSVDLGAKTPFGTTVDWNQDTLWLSLNVAGRAANCPTFGSGACEDDGEMLPMKRLTSTPYALNSGQLGGKTADNFVQLGQGVQTDASDQSSIFFNKTGNGNLVQLQNTAADVFTIGNAGDIILGSNANKTISVANAGNNTAGNSLSMVAGGGGLGDGSAGGDLVLQGGSAGGTNGAGGSISLDAGASTGTGASGTISIGAAHAGTIAIGSSSASTTQNISIGTNNTIGSVSNVTIGAGSSASGGSTTIQSKDELTIATNGTTRATFSDSENTVYFGNGESSSTPNDFKLQGTNSTSSTLGGGSLSLQGGNATVGDTNGGDIILSGGAGSGSGASGLVILANPTFSTVTNDANCYTDGAPVAANCAIAQSSVNDSAAVLVGFSTTGRTATLPDPTNKTAGRVIYVTATGDSENFTLAMNGGGAGNQVALRKNTTATLMWNGSDWTLAGTANTDTMQDIYDNTTGTKSVKVGNSETVTTLLTLDKASSAPLVADDALLGSMYYDTTLGKIQCYEAEGWGACGSSPDNFISLSPEYSNAVTNGSGIGAMTSDLCSDTLDINNGTSSQPLICGEKETYNFYNWTSAETAAQTKSIYVTYQLPTTFKEFVPGSTSLAGRTDGADASVTYEVYRSNSTDGLTSCGTVVNVATGALTTWNKAVATGTSDPGCTFAAGDSVIFKINMTASKDANAYVSNLNFAFSNR